MLHLQATHPPQLENYARQHAACQALVNNSRAMMSCLVKFHYYCVSVCISVECLFLVIMLMFSYVNILIKEIMEIIGTCIRFVVSN